MKLTDRLREADTPKPPPHEGLDPEIMTEADWTGAAWVLETLSQSLDDLEQIRIATNNRINAAIRDRELPDNDAAVLRLRALGEAIEALEKDAVGALEHSMKTHPLGSWVKQTKGIGLKQGARLIAAIGGDPTRWYDHSPIDPEDDSPTAPRIGWRPRTVSGLWKFAGYDVRDGEAPRRRKGEQSNWSREARMRAYLVAESCIKARSSPYRAVYDAGRAKYIDAVHAKECVRCGPAGKPAKPGSPLSDGHKHARAMRLVAKAVLKDLYREARRLKGMPVDEPRPIAA